MSVEAFGIVVGAALVAFFLLLPLFCALVVILTGDTRGLRDVAVVVRAFGGLFDRRAER